MKKREQRLTIVGILVALDIIFITLSFLSAYYLRFYNQFIISVIPITKGIPSLNAYFQLLIPAVVIWLLIFRSFGLYEVKPKLHESVEFYKIVKAITLGIVVLMAFTFFYREESYSRIVLSFIWVISIFFITIVRISARSIQVHLYKKGYGVYNTLIIGAGKIGSMVKDKINANVAVGHKVIGFLDDAYAKGEIINQEKVLGNLNDLQKVLSENDVDEVIIALPFRERQKIMDLAFTCEENYVKAFVVPDLFELIMEEIDINTLEGVPLMGLKDIPLSGWSLPVKRIEDLVFSAIGLILSSPLLIICAVLVKLSSPGPIIYKQERISRDGKIFIMYKFRCMYENAEKGTGPVWAKQDDPRRTAIGSLLRRLSLDELPQLWNIFKGDMSFVGPRSERPVFVKQFSEKIGEYFIRHKVKSGLTGWAQVNGLRGDTSIEERVKYDLYYVEHWSLTFDIKILLMTVFQIIAGKNAY